MDDATRPQRRSLRLISSVVLTAAVFLIGAAAVVVGWTVGWTVVPELMCRTVPRVDEQQAICEAGWALFGTLIAAQVCGFTGGVLAGLLRPSWRRLGAAMAGAAAGVLVGGSELDVELNLLAILVAVPLLGGIALAVGYGFGAAIEHGVRHPDTQAPGDAPP